MANFHGYAELSERSPRLVSLVPMKTALKWSAKTQLLSRLRAFRLSRLEHLAWLWCTAGGYSAVLSLEVNSYTVDGCIYIYICHIIYFKI